MESKSLSYCITDCITYIPSFIQFIWEYDFPLLIFPVQRIPGQEKSKFSKKIVMRLEEEEKEIQTEW